MRKVWIVETSSAQNNNCSFCSKSLFNNSHFPQSREWREALFCTFYTDNESLHLVCHWWHTACSFCVESSPWHLHLLTPSNDADHRTWKIQIFIKAKDTHNGVSQTVWRQKILIFCCPSLRLLFLPERFDHCWGKALHGPPLAGGRSAVDGQQPNNQLPKEVQIWLLLSSDFLTKSPGIDSADVEWPGVKCPPPFFLPESYSKHFYCRDFIKFKASKKYL